MHEHNSGAVSPTQAFRSALYVARHELYNRKNRQSKTLILGWYGLDASKKPSDTESPHRYRSLKSRACRRRVLSKLRYAGQKDALQEPLAYQNPCVEHGPDTVEALASPRGRLERLERLELFKQG